MKKIVALLLLQLVVFPLIAAEDESKVKVKETSLTWQQAKASDGEVLYVELCAVCHGRDGKGSGPAVEALAIAVPDLTQMSRLNDNVFPAAEAEETIRGELSIPAHGSEDMPIWGLAFRDVRPDWKPYQREGFAKNRIAALVSYVESIQAK